MYKVNKIILKYYRRNVPTGCTGNLRMERESSHSIILHGHGHSCTPATHAVPDPFTCMWNDTVHGTRATHYRVLRHIQAVLTAANIRCAHIIVQIVTKCYYYKVNTFHSLMKAHLSTTYYICPHLGTQAGIKCYLAGGVSISDRQICRECKKDHLQASLQHTLSRLSFNITCTWISLSSWYALLATFAPCSSMWPYCVREARHSSTSLTHCLASSIRDLLTTPGRMRPFKGGVAISGSGHS